ncbi:hypothetical protein EG878_16350 [Enterococcus faecalis]|nr:hypothetical protein EG878_16350 [Enterococcus faecalis]
MQQAAERAVEEGARVHKLLADGAVLGVEGVGHEPVDVRHEEVHGVERHAPRLVPVDGHRARAPVVQEGVAQVHRLLEAVGHHEVGRVRVRGQAEPRAHLRARRLLGVVHRRPVGREPEAGARRLAGAREGGRGAARGHAVPVVEEEHVGVEVVGRQLQREPAAEPGGPGARHHGHVPGEAGLDGQAAHQRRHRRGVVGAARHEQRQQVAAQRLDRRHVHVAQRRGAHGHGLGRGLHRRG